MKALRMHAITFYFDVISPYAWLAFDRLPEALAELDVAVFYEPVLFAGLLDAWGQKGPAEIVPKRGWIYRQTQWLARQQGTTLELPRPHPFNPLPLLRLALACADAGGHPNRHVVERVFRHAWCNNGADPNDPRSLATLCAELAPLRDPAGAEVKIDLRQRTEAAVAAGIFGVPTLVVGGRSFFGHDALPMLRAALSGDAWFDGPQWDAAGARPLGVARRR